MQSDTCADHRHAEKHCGLNAADASATRLAKLTTLRRLLEVKVAELEEGTGSLESDIRILEVRLASSWCQRQQCHVIAEWTLMTAHSISCSLMITYDRFNDTGC